MTSGSEHGCQAAIAVADLVCAFGLSRQQFHQLVGVGVEVAAGSIRAATVAAAVHQERAIPVGQGSLGREPVYLVVPHVKICARRSALFRRDRAWSRQSLQEPDEAFDSAHAACHIRNSGCEVTGDGRHLNGRRNRLRHHGQSDRALDRPPHESSFANSTARRPTAAPWRLERDLSKESHATKYTQAIKKGPPGSRRTGGDCPGGWRGGGGECVCLRR